MQEAGHGGNSAAEKAARTSPTRELARCESPGDFHAVFGHIPEILLFQGADRMSRLQFISENT